MIKQTAVEWLEGIFKRSCGSEFIDGNIEIFEQAREMENRQSKNYAEFSIHCDRQQMKILNFNDWIKL